MMSYDAKYKAHPMSRLFIRKTVEWVKTQLEIPRDSLYIDITKVLDLICEKDPSISYEIVENGTLGEGVHAESDVEKQIIYIHESVYNGAANNNGRDRMTIAHEIFHILTHHRDSVTLYRKDKGTLKPYENPEWQADCFAAEFLMPYDLIKDMTVSEIMNGCKVSEAAARYQSTHIKGSRIS